MGIACMALLVAIVGGPNPKNTRLVDRLSSDNNYKIRVQAATSLGELRQTEAVPALVRALDDDSDLVAISAAQALGKIGDCSVIDHLQKAQARSTSPGVKSQIEVTLQMLWTLSKKDQLRSHKTGMPIQS